MTLEQLKAFLAKVKNDTSLQDRLKTANSPEDVVAIAKEHGHDFSADKLALLSEEELENMSGGKSADCRCGGGWCTGCDNSSGG